MSPQPLIVDEQPAAITIDSIVQDECHRSHHLAIACEYPLTLYIDKKEIVTIMTLGQMPAALVIGWLRNQNLINSIEELEEVRIDWETHSAVVYTRQGKSVSLENETRTITSGCGQGTMFGQLMEKVETIDFERPQFFSTVALYHLLKLIRERETVYKVAGAVHACALFGQQGDTVDLDLFVEDIGRHNAVDAIAGWMWMNEIKGRGKIFYTTGRLTSEMVIKCAQMKIPYLVSRSGMTRMGYEVAHTVGLTALGRAMNRRFIVFSGEAFFDWGEAKT